MVTLPPVPWTVYQTLAPAILVLVFKQLTYPVSTVAFLVVPFTTKPLKALVLNLNALIQLVAMRIHVECTAIGPMSAAEQKLARQYGANWIQQQLQQKSFACRHVPSERCWHAAWRVAWDKRRHKRLARRWVRFLRKMRPLAVPRPRRLRDLVVVSASNETLIH